MDRKESTNEHGAIPYWIVLSKLFLYRIGSLGYIFLMLYLISQGYTIIQASIAAGIYSLGRSISIAGRLPVDRAGQQPMITLAILLAATAMLLSLHTLPFLAVLSLAFLIGFTSGLHHPTMSRSSTRLLPPEQQVQANTRYRFTLNTGIVAGSAIAGLFVNRPFFITLLVTIFFSMILSLLLLCALPVRSQPYTTASFMEEIKMRRSVQALCHTRSFLPFLLGTACLALISFQHVSPLILQTYTLNSSVVYGCLLSLTSIIILALELPLRTVTTKRSRQAIISFGWLLTSLGTGALGFTTAIPLLPVTLLFWAIGEFFHRTADVNPITDLALRHRPGHFKAEKLIWRVVQAAMPVLGALLFSWSVSRFWFLCGTIGSIVALLRFAETKRLAMLRSSFPPFLLQKIQRKIIPQRTVPHIPTRAVAYGGIVLVQLLYASFSPIAKPTLSRLDPVLFYCLMMLFLFPVALGLLIRWRSILEHTILVQGTMLGLCLGTGFLLLTLALKDTNITQTTIFSCVNGVVATLIAWLVLRQHVETSTWGACLFSIAGAAMVWIASATNWQGNCTAFIGGCLVTVYGFMIERWLVSDLRKSTQKLWPVLGVQLIAMTGIGLAFALCSGNWQTLTALRPSDGLVLGYTSIMATLVPLIFTPLLQRYVGAVTFAFFAVIEPLASSSLAFMMGERLTTLGYAGFGIVLAGVVLQTLMEAHHFTFPTTILAHIHALTEIRIRRRKQPFVGSNSRIILTQSSLDG